jgi:hypothetical protein
MKKKGNEESALTPEIEPYELATLAAQICPQLCQVDQESAIALAQKLVRVARSAILDEIRGRLELMQHTDYRDGVLLITERNRVDRAESRFLKYLTEDHGTKKAQALLAGYQKNGFTRLEAITLAAQFKTRQKAPAKGKQGRRRSKYDERLGIRPGGRIADEIPELRAGFRITPRKPLTFTAKEKAKIDKVAVNHGWKKKLDRNFAMRRPGEAEHGLPANITPGRGGKGAVGWATAKVAANARAKRVGRGQSLI